MMDQQRNISQASAVLNGVRSSMLSLPSLSAQPSTSTARYDSLASYLAQHSTLTSVQSNPVSVVTSVNVPSGSGMPVSTLFSRTPAPSFLQYRTPRTSNQVSSDCYTSGCQNLPLTSSTLAPSQNYSLLSNVNFGNRGVAPNVFESGSGNRVRITQFILRHFQLLHQCHQYLQS